MSTIVYQELIKPSYTTESYYTESRTLNLKLNSSNNTCSWSAIEAMSSKKDTVKIEKEESVYVHPLVERSSFMLSEKSLEMCTESLGNESGCCSMESEIFFPSSSSTTTTTKERFPRQKFQEKKEFPPPLTTISGGSNPIHVTQYREDGRLVIQAVSSPAIQSCLQAERSDGRLKLSLVRELSFDDDINEDEYEYEDEDEEEQEVEVEVEVEVEKEEVKECNSKKKDEYLIEDVNGITVDFGVKLGMKKIHRPSRCKEGGQANKRLINWEPFWVAT